MSRDKACRRSEFTVAEVNMLGIDKGWANKTGVNKEVKYFLFRVIANMAGLNNT